MISLKDQAYLVTPCGYMELTRKDDAPKSVKDELDIPISSSPELEPSNVTMVIKVLQDDHPRTCELPSSDFQRINKKEEDRSCTHC